MDGSDYLITVAEVAVAFVGFAAIVVTLRHVATALLLATANVGLSEFLGWYLIGVSWLLVLCTTLFTAVLWGRTA